jgi:hypothetical protein
MNDRERLEAIVKVVRQYLPPDGIYGKEAMGKIIELVDPMDEDQYWGKLSEEHLHALKKDMRALKKDMRAKACNHSVAEKYMEEADQATSTRHHSGEEHMIEQKILMWSLGFTVGVMTTIAVDKIVERDVLPPHSEAVRADELISIYKRGVRDALKTNPVSFELEQVCLEVWANKQPVEVK